MDLILRPSGGQNVVLRPQARPAWYPTGTVDAHQVEVFWQELDADGRAVGAPVSFGKFAADAVVSIPYNPVSADAKVRIYAVSYSASGVPDVAELRDAVQATVLFSRTATPVGGIDEHVPVITGLPVVSKATDNSELLLVFIPAPENAATLMGTRIRLTKADDPEAFQVWEFAAGPSHYVPQPAYDVTVAVSLQNGADEDVGNGRGWSLWSEEVAANGLANLVQPTPALVVNETFTYDPDDRRAPIQRGVIAE